MGTRLAPASQPGAESGRPVGANNASTAAGTTVAAAAEAAFSLQTLAATTTAVLFWKVSKVRTPVQRQLETSSCWTGRGFQRARTWTCVSNLLNEKTEFPAAQEVLPLCQK